MPNSYVIVVSPMPQFTSAEYLPESEAVLTVSAPPECYISINGTEVAAADLSESSGYPQGSVFEKTNNIEI